jgi:DNA primase
VVANTKESSMPGVDYRAVRALVSIGEVLDLLGVEPGTCVGSTWRGPCPLHGSRSPTSRSFEVHLGRNVYHCFRCGAAGNHLDLYAALTRQRLYAAAVDLCGKLQRDVPWLRRR